MKKQLLTALLAFTVVPFSMSQSSKAELLAHLKQVKVVIEKDLQEVSCEKNELQQKLGSCYSLLSAL